MADLNKIFVNSTLSVQATASMVMCFADGRLLARNEFTLLDGRLTLINDAVDNISLYYGYNNGAMYEYHRPLKNFNTIIAGMDNYGNTLGNIKNKNYIMVFVDGYVLHPNYYIVVDNQRIQLLVDYPASEIKTIQIYVSSAPITQNTLTIRTTETGNIDTTFNIGYDKNRTLFFQNGQKVGFQNITSTAANSCQINIPLELTDVLTAFLVPKGILSIHLLANQGYVDYEGVDYYSREIPVIYTHKVTFDDSASLLIDGLRPGFLIKEANGTGCLAMIGPDFDTATIYCDKIVPFSQQTYAASQYYIEVPECRSIVEYLSSFEKQYKLLPEILSVLQTLLLREIYDEAIRIKNLRNLTKVDSAYINKFITFLGFNMNIKRFPLKKRREILEELTNFYRIVGTKDSYNFFNIIESDFGITHIDQLFTYKNSDLPNQREYIDFFRMQDLGDLYHEYIEYQYPMIDYGLIQDNVGESYDYGRAIDEVLDDTDPTLTPDEVKKIRELQNTYDVEVSSVDYGFVSQSIKGKWVKWYTFDRPSNLYPTNHVDVDIEIKNLWADSATLLAEFKNKMYNLASAVLYIHKVSESYNFGVQILPDSGYRVLTKKIPQFGIMATPVTYSESFSISNDVKATKGLLEASKAGYLK